MPASAAAKSPPPSSFFADRMSAIAISPMARIVARTAMLTSEGKDVINLGVGEPDFDTPPNVIEAAEAAMRRGETRYTSVDGTAKLKNAVRTKFRRENDLDYAADEITIGAGAKQVIFNAVLATINPGDEVIIPAPYWSSYIDIVAFAQGRPVVVPCPQAADFKLRAEQLERAITKRTKWLFLNSPSNPTGAALEQTELRAIADVLLAHPHVWTMCDDIYEHLLFDSRSFATLAAIEPRLAERTLVVNGVSKTYCMTGWRVGYGAGPSALIRKMAAVQSQATSNPSTIGQAATIEALLGPQDGVKVRNAAFEARRDRVVEQLNGIDGLRCAMPQGAFYVYPDCSGLTGRRRPDGRPITNDSDLAEYLLEAEGVGVVQGAAFGLSPHLRISIAASLDTLSDACRRIARACSALH